MGGQAEENYILLKAKVGQVDLRELLQPHFAQLLEETTNPIELALILSKQGVMSLKKLNECISESMVLFQNFEVYRAVKKKNAGEALIDALYETGNFHILQLLLPNSNQSNDKDISTVNSLSNNLNIPVEPTPNIPTFEASLPAPKIVKVKQPATALKANCESKQQQVSILRSVSKATKGPNPVEPPESHKEYYRLSCMETVGAENLARLQEKNLDDILVRVVAPSDCGNSRKSLNSINIHLVDKKAIVKFLECQLDLDLNTQTVGRPPRELYVNTRSFSSQRWEWLSKLLYYFCRDTLEHLWLDEVNYGMYFEGTKWMKNLDEDEEPPLRFPKLKTFIFQGTNYTAVAGIFYDVLGLIKPLNCHLEKFWNFSECQIQIWWIVCLAVPAFEYKRLGTLIDPGKRTFFTFGADQKLQDEIVNLFKQGTTAAQPNQKSVPIVKLFYGYPLANIFTNSTKLSTLTHLCLRSDQKIKDGQTWNGYGQLQHVYVTITDLVMKSLNQMKLLQKLMLHSATTQAEWNIDLKQLDVLDHLSFLYLGMVKLNCSPLAMSHYPWRKAVQTVVLEKCEFALASTDLDLKQFKESRVVLERSRQANVNGPATSQPFTVSTIAGQDYVSYDAEMLREFFN